MLCGRVFLYKCTGLEGGDGGRGLGDLDGVRQERHGVLARYRVDSVEHLVPACRHETSHAHRRELAMSWFGHVVELQSNGLDKIQRREREGTYAAPPLVQDGVPELALAQLECGHARAHELCKHVLVHERDARHDEHELRQEVDRELVLSSALPYTT